MRSSRSDTDRDDPGTLARTILDGWNDALASVDEDEDASRTSDLVEQTQVLVDRLLAGGRAVDPSLLDELTDVHARLVAKLEDEMRATDASRLELRQRRRTLRCYATPSPATGQHLAGDA